MRLLRISMLTLALAFAAAAVVATPTDARASVSIAVAFDALVKDADAVAVVKPLEQRSVWEDGRIYTYTRVRVEQGVAGELGAGAEGWVRTMGGVVGKVGQLVDGEPVFVENKSSLLFLRRFQKGGAFEVSARSQGQYPVVRDDSAKIQKIVRSANVGVLLPPKAKVTDEAAKAGSLRPQGAGQGSIETAPIRLAGEVLHDRPLAEITREIASAWTRLHPAAAPKSK
jgi:hypothetical protein